MNNLVNVYKIECTVNSKVYIGITKKPIQKRFHKHYINAVYGIDTYFHNSIRKYGINNFKISLLEEVDSWEKAQVIESYYIKKYNSFKNGFNSILGGEGGDLVSKLPKNKYDNWLKKI